ncbi:MAG TPA: hypothetical protein VIL36_09770 [Acidimicrobiales bacterium]
MPSRKEVGINRPSPEGASPPAGDDPARRWDEREAAILDALRDLRALALRPLPWSAPTTAAAGGLGLVDVVRGSDGVWQAFWLHADLHARPKVDAIVPDIRPLTDVLSGEAAEAWAELQRLLASGDVRIRLILPTAVESTMARAVVEQMVAAGIDVRLADTSAWYFVSSEGMAAVPLVWAKSVDVDVGVVRGGPLVAALAELFEHRWRAARPWIRDEHDAVLRLFATGLGDEDVARELGTSVRTVRRRVAEAMAAYGASTRFELGYRYATEPGEAG